ncbi:MAG: glycosyltransferase family 2 protein [Acidimicrobiales bacterium]
MSERAPAPARVPTAPAPIAVIVCTYHRPGRLVAAVDRIFRQAGTDQQYVIVVNDGSRDEGRTEAAIAALGEQHGRRLVAVHHPVNTGVAAARSTGVAAAVAHGAHVLCFHDDDDYWDEHRLVRGYAPFADPAVALTFGEQLKISDAIHSRHEIVELWSAPSRGYRSSLLDALIRGRVYFPFQTAMIRTDLCGPLLPFKDVPESEDLDFVLRAWAVIERTPGLSAVRLPEILAYHVGSADSLSYRDENRSIRSQVHREILAEHMPRPVVDLAFALSNRVLRPLARRIGRAQEHASA